MGVLDKVRTEIARHKMVESGQLVIVGVSGGPDSVALLHMLRDLEEELEISLHAAHLNHMFRGEEAKGDANFVWELCARWGIPCTVEERNVPAYAREKRLSAQVAAREVRYQFFSEVLHRTGGNRLALAHHANDQAESVLMNILRGSGLKGLSGIAPVRDNVYIRPLLGVRRDEIERYCQEKNIAFRTDSSNLKTVYRRNKLRKELIPLLEREYSSGLVTILGRMAEQARSEEEFLESLAVETYNKVLLSKGSQRLMLDRRKLADHPAVLARRVLRVAWEQLQGSKQNLTFDHIENLVNHLQGGGAERILELPAGVKVRVAYDVITLMAEDLQNNYHYSYELPVPGSIVVPETGIKITSKVIDRQELTFDPKNLPPNVVAMDYAQVSLPLGVRSRQEGDVLVPFGIGKKVKLKKIFIDRKVPRHKRNNIPLVVEQKTGKILWVAGIRMTHDVGITVSTGKIILLSVENGNSSNT